MEQKLKIAVVGLGKMGLSHFAMVNAHPATETIACDTSGLVVDILSKNSSTRTHKDFDKLLAEEKLDAVVIATPSKSHGPMVRAALDRGIHVFCEKPFCLNWEEGQALAELAEAKNLVTQVGYHYRFVGAFQEMNRILQSGALGTVTHILAEAYGPVVLRPKRQTWRSNKSEGGGCLYDYAAHPINLLNWNFGAPDLVTGSVLNSVFSSDVDDEVFSTLRWNDGPTAQLSVNWSDESHRKMSTKISIIGTNGRLNTDRQECQVYLRKPVPELPNYKAGWTVRYTTDLTEEVSFYLRGEEYSAQLDSFIKAVAKGSASGLENSFRSATETDKTMAMIIENNQTGIAVGQAPKQRVPEPAKRGWFNRVGA